MTEKTQTADQSPNAAPTAPVVVPPTGMPTTMPAPVPTPAPEPVEAPVAAPESRGEGEVLTIPRRAMAKLKKEERERGRKALVDDLQARAMAAGFDSWEEMLSAAEKTDKRKKPVQKMKQKTTGAEKKAREPQDDLSLDEVRRLNKAHALEMKRRKNAEMRVQAMEAEVALRASAIRAGVKDVDYALELLKRSIRGKTAEELTEFNEDTFFGDKLKKSHPYLYTATESPAHTVPTTTTPESKPTPPTPPTNGGPVDARKLTSEEYNALLKKHGIKNPTLGF